MRFKDIHPEYVASQRIAINMCALEEGEAIQSWCQFEDLSFRIELKNNDPGFTFCQCS